MLLEVVPGLGLVPLELKLVFRHRSQIIMNTNVYTCQRIWPAPACESPWIGGSCGNGKRTVEVRGIPPFVRKKRRMGHPPLRECLNSEKLKVRPPPI